MFFRPKCFFWIAISAVCFGQDQREWSESQIVERFLMLSPQAQELRAHVALTEAEGKTRTAYPNPSVSYSREGAGYNEFFEASQTLPVNGRVRYLRDGTLMLADEIWYDKNLRPIERPRVLVPAYTPPNELTPESQHGF